MDHVKWRIDLLCEAVISGDWGSGVHGSNSSTLEHFLWVTWLEHGIISSGLSGSLWHTVNTFFRITLKSLAWLVCSWSATPEIPKKSRCMRSSALWNPAGPLGLDFLVLESELLVRAGLALREGGEEGPVCGAVAVGRGVVVADGSAFSTGSLVPRWGKGSTSSRTAPPSAPVATGRGSKTVVEDSLESRLKEWLLCSCWEGAESVSPEGEALDCPWAESGLLGGAATEISLEIGLVSSWVSFLLLFLTTFFLAAAALSLLCSSVPSPSALQRAFSRVFTCSGVR